MQRDHIRLGHAARIDALGRLHLRQRLDAIAQRGGAFEFQRLGRLGHIPGQLGLHLRRLALQEPLRIRHQRAIARLVDMADARGGAALDLVKQAGPRPAGEHRVRAVAQEKDLLQLVQRPVDRARAGEGAVIVALFLLRAAMLLDLREGVFLRNEDIRKGFVVPQQHVEIGLQLLDEVLFQQQRLGFRPRRQEHHRLGRVDHPGDARRMAGGAGIVRHPRLEVARLADIKHPAFGIEHPVDARLRGQGLQIGLNDLMPGYLTLRHPLPPLLPSSAPTDPGADSPVRAATLRALAQEKSCPRILWISLVKNFGRSGFFLVFG